MNSSNNKPRRAAVPTVVDRYGSTTPKFRRRTPDESLADALATARSTRDHHALAAVLDRLAAAGACEALARIARMSPAELATLIHQEQTQ